MLDDIDAIYDKDGKHIGFLRRVSISELKESLPECPVPNPNETNKGKQILQQQQNITCRINSLRQLLQQLQHDMSEHSPDAACLLRLHLLHEGSLIDRVQILWLTDTRRLISHAEKNDRP